MNDIFDKLSKSKFRSSFKLRDKDKEYIKSKGIRVYRIKWNTINTKKGKNEMQNKINNFLEYYRNL